MTSSAPAPAESDEITIIGGGPGGMFLAWLLVQQGVPVHLIERHPDFTREFRGEGIQASVVRHLNDLGLLDSLLQSGIAVPAAAARVFVDDRPVAVLRGIRDGEDFGIILYQDRFLTHLHNFMLKSDFYRATLGTAVTGFRQSATGIDAVIALQGADSCSIAGANFVVAAGRNTALRKQLQLESIAVDTHWNILWLRFGTPPDPALIPDGFRAYLTGDALFILYRTAENGIQLAWGRREESVLRSGSWHDRRQLLLSDAPAALYKWLQDSFTADTPSQFLRVQSDRLLRWFHENVLFIGDAAHSMSPVAGQGINLALRDAIVAANHLLQARTQNQGITPELGRAFQAEREYEIRVMQRFQRIFGYFMLGAPRWQVRGFFQLLLPLLNLLGIRRQMLRRVQGGVSRVSFQPPQNPRHQPRRELQQEAPCQQTITRR